METINEVRQHPILFSTEMVRAILNGSKTQTRRIVKMRDGSLAEDEDISKWPNGELDKVMDFSKTFPQWQELKCPYGKVGDLLWVRETAYFHKQEQRWIYKASEPLTDSIEYGYRWKPSIFMPKDACRIFLEITNVKVERLQDISEEDAKAEGVLYYGEESDDYKNYMYDDKDGDDWGVTTAVYSFQTLWEKINGKESLDANPWVWCISFKRTNP